MSPSYWPALKYGGPIYSVHSLNKELAKKGIDVIVYTTNVGLSDKVPVNEKVDVDGVKIFYFEYSGAFEFLGATGWQFSQEMTNSLRKAVRAFDLIHINAVWNYPIAAAAFYCRKYKKPYIITPRGTLYPYTIGKNAWKKWPYYKLVAERAVKGAAAIHYTTKDEAEKCHSSLGLVNQAIVIPNGIDMTEFNDFPVRKSLRERYPSLKDKKIILFLGRVHWIKGLDILVSAFSKLARQRDDVHLLIVGNDEGRYSEKVKGWIRDYGMKYVDYGVMKQARGDRYEAVIDRRKVKVTFTGMLKGRVKLEALAGSDIFVLPSYSENFGIAVIEAMACGLPVVISDQVGIYKEVAKAKAGVVIETDVMQLAEAMANLLDNPDSCEEIGENGRRLVEERFSWDKIAMEMIEVYRGILRSQSVFQES